MIGGLSDIDVDDWERHTDYRGYHKDDQPVKWFWQAVKAWPMEKRSRLLQVSACSSYLVLSVISADRRRLMVGPVRDGHLAHAGERI